MIALSCGVTFSHVSAPCLSNSDETPIYRPFEPDRVRQDYRDHEPSQLPITFGVATMAGIRPTAGHEFGSTTPGEPVSNK